jgi:hypothetical protein
MPIGMPGWPLFAASTASIASARIALASVESETRGAAVMVVVRTFAETGLVGGVGAERAFYHDSVGLPAVRTHFRLRVSRNYLARRRFVQ